jgi:hypothetical protein
MEIQMIEFLNIIFAILNAVYELTALVFFLLLLTIVLSLWFRWLSKSPVPEPTYSADVKVKVWPFWNQVLK